MGKPKTVRRSKASAEPGEPSPQQLEIYDELCQGALSQREIADKHGISQARVSRIGKSVDEWLIPIMMDQIRETKVRQANFLEHVKNEAMKEWDRSKLPAYSVTRKDSEENGTDVTKTKKFQTGDVACLNAAIKASDHILKIWGAYAPQQVEHIGEIRVAGMTEAEMNADMAEQLSLAHKKVLEVKAEPDK